MKNAVEIENLSKKYSIGERERYLTFRDMAMKMAKAPMNILKGKGFKKKDVFWALNDVNFTVKEGEVVGVIGKNGAGKSTLLKILSRITEPTHGTVKLNGRISSLLEVGTGFHPELTGRENIFLNGAILGMSRREIERKFDEIVEFSGVEKFLDMPVKRYSSGMQVRLAFSVAAHLEPDILIIDEVLAVGDAEFQKKCLGKMDEVTKEAGRTILFVSHDMGAIQRLCDRTVLLENGTVKFFGDTDKAIELYLKQAKDFLPELTFDNDESKIAKITSIKIKDNGGNVSNYLNITDEFNVEIEYMVNTDNSIVNTNVILNNTFNHTVFATSSTDSMSSELKPKKAGKYTMTFTTPKPKGLFINPGMHWLRISVGSPNSRSYDSVVNIPLNFMLPQGYDNLLMPERISALTIDSKWKLSN